MNDKSSHSTRRAFSASVLGRWFRMRRARRQALRVRKVEMVAPSPASTPPGLRMSTRSDVPDRGASPVLQEEVVPSAVNTGNTVTKIDVQCHHCRRTASIEYVRRPSDQPIEQQGVDCPRCLAPMIWTSATGMVLRVRTL